MEVVHYLASVEEEKGHPTLVDYVPGPDGPSQVSDRCFDEEHGPLSQAPYQQQCDLDIVVGISQCICSQP